MYKVLIPGDFISDQANRAGEGTYVEEGKVYAMRYGIVEEKEEIKVVPISGKYVPKRGDLVIGRIIDISFPHWVVDIASPYNAWLHVSQFTREKASQRIEFGDMHRYLNVGDLIAAKVTNVDMTMKIELAMLNEDSGLNFKMLRGSSGRLVEISHTKVPRVIGRNGSMIKMLKEKSRCFIFVAKNGRIWVKGREENVDIASELILKIANEAHTSGLTDRIAYFLDERKRSVK